MNRFPLTPVVALVLVSLLAGPTLACIPPDVSINGWMFRIGTGDSIELEAEDESGTYITSWNNWYFSPSSGYTILDADYVTGTDAWTTVDVQFNEAGSYYVKAKAYNSYTYDWDFAYVYVVEVDSVTEFLSGAEAIYVPVDEEAFLQANPNPDVSWPSGEPTWSLSFTPIPPGSQTSASITASSDGAAMIDDIDAPGVYTATARCGTGDSGSSISVLAFAVDITEPENHSGSTVVGVPLSLECEPTVDISGSYAWTVSPSSGATVAPDTDPSHATFTATQTGVYTVTVAYSKDYDGLQTATATDECVINVIAPDVTITNPAAFPRYLAVYDYLSFQCQTSGAGGGSIQWYCNQSYSHLTAPNSETTSFYVTEPGDYTVGVIYTEGGQSAADMSGEIRAFEVDITTSPTSIYVDAPLTLSCSTSHSDGTLTWSGDGGSITPAADPHTATFTASQAGTYHPSVQYTRGGGVYDTDSVTVTVVNPTVEITQPSASPSYLGITGEREFVAEVHGTSGGSYSWTATGPGTVTWTPSQNDPTPEFSADTVGTYTVQVTYTYAGGSLTDTAYICVIDVEITEPDMSEGEHIDMEVGDQAQVTCASLGASGGTFTWAKGANGPGTLTFSPNGTTSASSSMVSASEAGNYTAQVTYAKSPGGNVVDHPSGWIYVTNPETDIVAPSDSVSIEDGDTLDLECEPSSRNYVGTFLWSKVSGPGTVGFPLASTSTSEDTVFAASEPGNYQVKVEYTKGGYTDTKTSPVITVTPLSVDLAATSQANPDGSFNYGMPVELTCTPSGTGGTITWSVTPSTNVVWTPSDPTNHPVVTVTASPGQLSSYQVTATYSKQNALANPSVSDVETINILPIGVDITSPSESPGSVPLGGALSMSCETLGATGGEITWLAYSAYPPTGDPTSALFSEPHATTTTFTPTQLGWHTIRVAYTLAGATATCDLPVWVFQIVITSPTGTDRDVAFDDSSAPGICTIGATATTGMTSLDAQLEWTLESVDDPYTTTSPAVDYGASATFTYSGLPSSNDDFGPKTLTVMLRDTPGGTIIAQTTGTVRVFFDPTATNHPLILPDEPTDYTDTPNWFYYWRKGSVVEDLDQFSFDGDNEELDGYYNGIGLYICAGVLRPYEANWTLENPFHTTVNAGADGVAKTEALTGDIQVMQLNEVGDPGDIVVDPGNDGFLNEGMRSGSFTYDGLEPDDQFTTVIEAEYNMNCDRLHTVAITVQHEMTHQQNHADLIAYPGGDNEKPDGVHDTIRENCSPYWLCPAMDDTFGFRLYFTEYPGGGSGEDEFLAWMSEMNCTKTVNGSADWTEEGRQWQVGYQ